MSYVAHGILTQESSLYKVSELYVYILLIFALFVLVGSICLTKLIFTQATTFNGSFHLSTSFGQRLDRETLESPLYSELSIDNFRYNACTTTYLAEQISSFQSFCARVNDKEL